MRDVLGPGTTLGYCTNVHAGATWEQTRINLEQYAARVQQIATPQSPLPIGLWLSAQTAQELLKHDRVGELMQTLDANGLRAFTMNGFPHDDFHQPIVKHAVYRPHWGQRERLEYTCNLAAILAELLEEGEEGSISTLPLGWPSDMMRLANLRQCGVHLHELSAALQTIEDEHGCLIHIDIEPEPGCQLQDSLGLVAYLGQLFNGKRGHCVQRYIRVCHDVCHAAVMFENQDEMFDRYRAAGVNIGKVQISNAIRADLRNLSARERRDALAQLRQFSEDRYLHQTMVRDGDSLRFYDDLPKAFAEYGLTDRAGDEWRVHFHVPVYLESFGLLKSTRGHIIECMKLLRGSEVRHWEVETYAWNVLPDELKVPDLAEGIAQELKWVQEQARALI